MKKAIIILTMLVAGIASSYTQSKRAIVCGSGCNLFTVNLKSDGACGNSNDYIFTVTNIIVLPKIKNS